MVCELLCRCIQNVADIAKAKGRKMPEHLILVTDNTVAFAKNSTCIKFLALLVLLKHFASTALFSLTKQHSHEDADQLCLGCRN